MRRFAEATAVPVAKSKAEIDALLRAWSCDGIRWTNSFSDGVVVLEFLWTHEGTQYLARFSVKLPTDDDLRREALDGRSRRFSSAKFAKLQEARGRQEHRLLLLWLKAALNAVEAGIVTAEALFLPFLVGNDGRTVADVALPQMGKLLGHSAHARPAAAGQGCDEVTNKRKIEPIEAWALAKGGRGILARNIVAHEALALGLVKAYEGLSVVKVRIVPDEPCAWYRDADMGGTWQACNGNMFEIYEGTLSDNEMNFCPYCGQRIEEE